MIDFKDFWKYKGKFFTNKEWDFLVEVVSVDSGFLLRINLNIFEKIKFDSEVISAGCYNISMSLDRANKLLNDMDMFEIGDESDERLKSFKEQFKKTKAEELKILNQWNKFVDDRKVELSSTTVRVKDLIERLKTLPEDYVVKIKQEQDGDVVYCCPEPLSGETSTWVDEERK